jgi:two-component system sensor histidine kinase RegB
MVPSPALTVNFAFLSRLRWGAAAGQLLVILVVRYGLGTALPIAPLCAVVTLELAFNAWCALRLGKHLPFSSSAPAPIAELHVTLSVGVDLLLFSALLYLTGGPANPFSFLYLIHIALAALVLPPRTSYALVAAALGCSLLLFWFNLPLPHDHAHHMHEYGWHLRGMWVAFGLAAGCIVYFMQRVLRELRGIEDQLAASRERETRSEAVAALAMLSAGAAHELASPLSTIALASGELLRRLPEGEGSAALRDDVLLIRGQVERCRTILEQLAAEAGQAQSSSFGEHTWQAIVEPSLSGLDSSRVHVQPPAGESPLLRGSLGALAQALRNLLNNALEASAPEGAVTLLVSQGPGELSFAIQDEGPGMSPEVLARATEPFFTTKPRGRGMGLGLFLAQSVAEQLGGRLELSSERGRGTRATLVLPTAATIGRMVARGGNAQAAASHG